MSVPDRRIEMSSALTGSAELAEIAAALDGIRVVVVVPNNPQPAVATAAAGLLSMAGRVFGGVKLRGDGAMPFNPWNATTLDHAVRMLEQRSIRTNVSTKDLVVVFGSSGTRGDWYIGGDDWTAIVSRRPVDIGRCVLGGLGLHAAAAVLFGEILKTVLRPLGMRCIPIETTLIWNLLDGRLAPAPNYEYPLGLNPVAIVSLGAGSLGSSALGCLTMTPVTGSATVVDPDVFDPGRNAYRYPAIAAGFAGPKAQWGADVLTRAGWETEQFVGTIAEWVRSRSTPGFDGIALVSVDRVDGRLDAADLLARITVSAGVSGLALHAHLSDQRDDLACSYCAYVDASLPMTQVDVYSALTGIDGDRIIQLLRGDRLNPSDVRTAVTARKIVGAGSDGLIGGRLEDLLNRRYAQAQVPVGDSGLVADVSAPHVSWLGGILLATEVVKAAAGLPLLDRRVEIDLTGIPLGGWRSPRRDPTGRCPCTNPTRRSLARRLYAA